MSTLSDIITRNNLAWDEQRQALIDMGQSVPLGTPVEEYPIKTRQISGGEFVPSGDGWIRPLDRPEKPTMVDNRILILFGVSKDSPNDFSILPTANGGGVFADWGDGSTNTNLFGTKMDHMYNFDTIDVPVDSQGYKMVWITLRPIGAQYNIIGLNILQRHSQRTIPIQNVPVFEMYIQCPQLETLTWGTTATVSVIYGMLEIFSLGENHISSCHYLLCNCHSLKKIEELYLDEVRTMNYFLYYAYAFNGIIPWKPTYNMTATSFLYNCYTYNQPIDWIVRTVGSNFMNNCRCYGHSITVDLADIGSDHGLISSTNYAQKGLRILNMQPIHTSLSVANSNMDTNALELLFGDLYDRTGLSAGTITISNCYGASKLTAAQRLIATSKNWSIVG